MSYNLLLIIYLSSFAMPAAGGSRDWFNVHSKMLYIEWAKANGENNDICLGVFLTKPLLSRLALQHYFSNVRVDSVKAGYLEEKCWHVQVCQVPAVWESQVPSSILLMGRRRWRNHFVCFNTFNVSYFICVRDHMARFAQQRMQKYAAMYFSLISWTFFSVQLISRHPAYVSQ